MFFLREEFLKVNDKRIKIREFTFRELMIFEKIESIEAQLLFILDAQKIEGKITQEIINDIISAAKKVNESKKREKPTGPTIQTSMEEQVDYLCKRWGGNPLDLIDRFSKEMIFEWNSICRNHDNKIYFATQKNDIQSKINKAKSDPDYKKLKETKPMKELSKDFFKKQSKRG